MNSKNPDISAKPYAQTAKTLGDLNTFPPGAVHGSAERELRNLIAKKDAEIAELVNVLRIAVTASNGRNSMHTPMWVLLARGLLALHEPDQPVAAAKHQGVVGSISYAADWLVVLASYALCLLVAAPMWVWATIRTIAGKVWRRVRVKSRPRGDVDGLPPPSNEPKIPAGKACDECGRAPATCVLARDTMLCEKCYTASRCGW